MAAMSSVFSISVGLIKAEPMKEPLWAAMWGWEWDHWCPQLTQEWELTLRMIFCFSWVIAGTSEGEGLVRVFFGFYVIIVDPEAGGVEDEN